MSNAVLELHKGEHSIRGYRCAYDDELFPCNTAKAYKEALLARLGITADEAKLLLMVEEPTIERGN
jgi:hypothetical protein